MFHHLNEHYGEGGSFRHLIYERMGFDESAYPERRPCHAILEFDEPIVGPLVIGAGRYLGYGLCHPIDPEP